MRKNLSNIFILAITVSILAGVLQPVSATRQSIDQEIANYVIDQLSYNQNDDILSYIWGPLDQGQSVQGTKEQIFVTPSSGYVMYIDPYPQMNLFHPVKYVFISEQTSEISEFNAQSPPSNFQDYRLIDSTFSEYFYSIQNRRTAIIKPGPEKSLSGRDNRWAVLMNGGYDSGNNHVRYWNDLSNIYITLNEVYEIPDENIIVLCSDGTNTAPDQSNGQNSNPDLDGDGDADIMYSCVLSNVNAVFADLSNNFTIYDKLFVFTTDHGDTAGGWNTIENLWNHEELTDAHFAALLAAFPECEKICTLEPCFSGGFLDNIVVPPGPIVASSACAYNEYSYAMSNLVYDEYVFYWTAAVKGEDAYGNPVDADINEDGTITMDEAYIYAEEHDTATESPQYDDYPEGFGESVSLKVSSPPPAQPSKPSGPNFGVWNEEYSYTSSTTEPDGEQIYYMFNWGDGTNSGWVGPYNSGQNGTGSHIWTELGNFSIKVKARDIWGSSSPWSEPLVITIVDNTPPEAPTISGPKTVRPLRTYTYTIVATDPQDQDVYLDINWGGGSGQSGIGPYHSGEQVKLEHSWKYTGNYTIKVRASDIQNADGPWTTFEIKVTRSRDYSYSSILQILLERFPNAFPLIRHMLGY